LGERKVLDKTANRVSYNDFVEGDFDIPPTFIANNNYMNEINRVAKEKSLTYYLYFAPSKERFFLTVTNKYGFNTFFMWIEEPDGSFRPVDNRTVIHVKQTLEYFQNSRLFYKALREKREEVKNNKDKKELEEFNYICCNSKRLFQRVGRALGYNSGKTNLPR
jgi:hypothetical protein